MAKPSKAHFSEANYTPPQPMFAICPDCKALCLKGKTELLSGALGFPHKGEDGSCMRFPPAK